jgi:hypothetical protein
MEFIYFRTDDAVATKRAAEFLPEGRHYTIDSKWSVRVDNPVQPGQQKHAHIQLKGRDIAVVNQDGTPSHSSDLSQVPGWLLTKATKLTESFVVEERVPASVIAYAISHEETVTRSSAILSKMSGKSDG